MSTHAAIDHFASRTCVERIIDGVLLTPWVTFVEACRLGTLSATAELLGYTQSAVSRQLASLEQDLGVTLMTRKVRGVRPTVAGEALLPHARLVVAEAERGRRAAGSATPAPQILIGAVPSAAVSMVPAALRQMPDAPAWSMITGLTPSLVDRVGAGEIDLGIVTDAPPGLPEFAYTTEQLGEDRMAVVLPTDHPLAHRKRLRITELAGERWIEDNLGSETMLQQLAARHRVGLDIDRTASDLMTKVALVAAGHGVGFVPHMLGPALRPDVRLVDLTDAPRRSVYAVSRPNRTDLRRLVAAMAGSLR